MQPMKNILVTKIIKIKNLNKLQKEYLYNEIKKDKERFFYDVPENAYTILENNVVIPAFIDVSLDTVKTLWVSENFRRKGYGKFLVGQFKIKYVEALDKSVPFWKSQGFCIINSKGTIQMKKIIM